MSDKHGRVLPPHARLSPDPALVLASAEKIKALHITHLLTGHGAPVSG